VKIEAIGHAAKFVDVPVGKFFCALGDERLFGFTVTDSRNSKTGALIFGKQSGQRGVPWLSSNGLLGEDLAYFPEATIRADWKVVGSKDGVTFGAIISCGGKFFIRAADGIANFATFDLSSGIYDPDGIAAGNAVLVYPSWQLGHYYQHGEFVSLFSFPDEINNR
jgi:hypothetical protein